MHRSWWCGVAAAGVLSSVSVAQDGAAAAQSQPLAVRLIQMLHRHDLGQFWGAVLVASEGNVLVANGYGLADDAGRPIDRATLFDVGSVTKQFTAAAVLRLREQGTLSLDEPVATYLPGLEGAAAARARTVTLRHLLSHTSGMDDRVAIRPINFTDRDAAVAAALGSTPAGEPGAAFEYCNAGYIVAAAIIERVSGVAYEQFVVDEVLRPAGMKTAGFINGVGIDPALVGAARVVESERGGRSYSGVLVNDPREQLGWGLKGAGGLAASLDDMLAWGLAIADGTVLDEASRADMFRPGPGNYGLGWFITLSPTGTPAWSHSGGTRGFTAQFTVYPKERAVIGVLTNARNSPVELSRMLEAKVFGVSAPGPLDASLMFGALQLGEYFSDSWKGQTELRVTRAGDGPGERVTLEVVRDGSGAVARVGMSAESARALAAEIRAVSGIERPGEPGGPGSYCVAGYIYRDEWPDKKPPAEFRLSGVQWTVLPEYRGQGEGGKVIVDPRPTLVLMDEQRGFWPLIITIRATEARRLADELAPAKP